MSIKKEYCELIKSKNKIYEFRTKVPKRLPINKIYVYEMLPTSALKYILTVDTPIIFPDKVTSPDSFGALEFNQGNSKNKVAYPILSMIELDTHLSKDILKEKYNLSPPQSFVYLDTYKQLQVDLLKAKTNTIF